MSADIQTFIQPLDARAAGYCDYAVSLGSLTSGADLKSAVLVSLFTDRRALRDDPLPDPREGRRGWWADATLDPTGNPAELIGSRLWLLYREKTTPAAIERAKTYLTEALQWLIADGVAQAVRVEVERQQPNSGRDVLAFRVEIDRPTGITTEFAYAYAWRVGELLDASA